MRHSGSLSSYFIRIGALLLLGALFSSLAALYTITSVKHVDKEIVTRKPYYSIIILDLFKNISRKKYGNIAGIDITIMNKGASKLLILTAPYTNISVTIQPSENITLTNLSPLDNLVIHTLNNSGINVSLKATIHFEYKPYLVLGLLGLLLFLAGSILLSAGIIIRFSGVEEAFA